MVLFFWMSSMANRTSYVITLVKLQLKDRNNPD